MESAFSSPATDAITRTIPLDLTIANKKYASQEIDEHFEISSTAERIKQGNFKRTALQFPDELLHVSVPIFSALKVRVEEDQELYVLADTSYGSCCVDEVAAQHVDADAIVHYGHACMSQTSRLPVIYVFGKEQIDVDDCVKQFSNAFLPDGPLSAVASDPTRAEVVLKCDVGYVHAMDILVDRLREALKFHQVTLSYAPPQCSPCTSLAVVPPNAPSHSADVISPTMLYIGPESVTLTNLLMTNSTSQVYAYSPLTMTARLESSLTNKLLMRRYAVIQKARDADVFGILVGTLGVSSYLPLITYLRTMLSRSKKKFYTVSVGKLNPAKLANFLEIECWVLVACPEGSLIGDSKEFLRPIVTPYELQLALAKGQGWTGKFVLDFQQVLAGADIDSSTGNDVDDDEDDDRPHFSLVTGKYRHAKRYGGESDQQAAGGTDETAAEGAVVLRNQDSSLTTNGSSYESYLQMHRTYKGLEARVGKDAPSVLEQGRSGIAASYGEIEQDKDGD